MSDPFAPQGMVGDQGEYIPPQQVGFRTRLFDQSRTIAYFALLLLILLQPGILGQIAQTVKVPLDTTPFSSMTTQLLIVSIAVLVLVVVLMVG